MPLIDKHGVPLRRSAPRAVSRGGSAFAGASFTDPALHTWSARLDSADSAILPERNELIARTRDLVRNDGWASSGLQKHLDGVVGAGWRLALKPDYRALGLPLEWAREFAAAVEAEWRLYMTDPDNFADLTRHSSGNDLIGLGYRHRIRDGEALAIVHWRERGGRYNTCIEIVDPDRLSNPKDAPDTDKLRGGVALDDDGVAIAYHIRKKHPGDFFAWSRGSFEWTEYARELGSNRPQVIHDFDREFGGQTRPTPPLAPILKKFRMLTKYDEAELQASVINAILAAYITSPLDPEVAAQAFATGGLDSYQQGRLAFHEESKLTLAGAQLQTLYPGEQITFTETRRPAGGYGEFETAILRNLAAALGLSYEQLAMDWSKTNYSSARAALLEVWKFFAARRAAFAAGFMRPWFCAWMEEAVMLDRIALPDGAPAFHDAKAAYTRGRWIGPSRGWIDPVKEAQGAQLRMEVGVSTLEAEAAEYGLDWEEVMEQRAFERQRAEELGLPAPGPVAADGPDSGDGRDMREDMESGGR